MNHEVEIEKLQSAINAHFDTIASINSKIEELNQTLSYHQSQKLLEDAEIAGIKRIEEEQRQKAASGCLNGECE